MNEDNNKKTLREKLLGFKQKAEINLEKEKKEKQNKIKFYKKIWFSITKFNKYPEMAKEGAKSATKYLIGIVAFFSAILSVISSYEMDNYREEGLNYIKENLPEIVYSEGTLKSDTIEKVTLEHDFIKEIAKGIVIIDTSVEDETIINNYIEEIGEEQRAVILLKNKLITVNWKEENKEYNYQDLLKQYASRTATQEVSEVKKDDVIYYVQNHSYSLMNYIIQYFISYIIIYFGNFIIYVGVVTLIGYITSKILKLKNKFKEIYSMTVYAFTLPIIIYMIYTISYYFIKITIPYFSEMFIIIAYIYLLIVLFKMKTMSKEGEN